MKQSFKAQAGFTLIEVIVVVLLLGITAALVLPRGMGSATNSAVVDSQAQELAGMLRLARAKAMAGGNAYNLTINTDICRIEPAGAAAAPVAQMTVDDRVTIMPQPPLGPNVVFNAQGLPPDGGGTIKLQTKGGQPETKSLVINEQGMVDIR